MVHSTKSWNLSRGSLRWHKRTGKLLRAVHTRKRSRGSPPYYTGRITFYKQGMIKYKYSGHPTQLDLETPWKPAPAQYRRSHSMKRHFRQPRSRRRRYSDPDAEARAAWWER